ncbi:MAG: LysE family translocator [Burkholderiales bacterium]|nr:LysE family translocator [Burkholderiales bacterium]
MSELLGLAGAREALLFAAAVLALNATPGVDLLLTVSRTLHAGARAGLAAALGITLGCAVHALAAASGLAALLAVSPAAFVVLKWAGAAYLVWLAIGMARNAWRGGSRAGLPAAPPRRLAGELRVGFLTNVLNPKVALFFLAFLPQFIAPAAPHKTLAFLGLGLWFVLQSAVFLAAVVALAARARRVAAPRLGRWLEGLGACLLGLLALRMVRS